MKTHLNLIPQSIQRRQVVAQTTRVWSLIVGMVGLVCALACIVEWTRGVAAAERLELLTARFAPVRELIAEKQELEKLVADLRARETLTLQLSNETPGITLLGVVSEAARDLDGSVYLQRLDFVRQPNDRRGQTGTRTVRLEGAGHDSIAVAAFASHLRDSGLFSAVEVDSTRPIEDPITQRRRFRFEIDCVL